MCLIEFKNKNYDAKIKFRVLYSRTTTVQLSIKGIWKKKPEKKLFQNHFLCGKDSPMHALWWKLVAGMLAPVNISSLSHEMESIIVPNIQLALKKTIQPQDD